MSHEDRRCPGDQTWGAELSGIQSRLLISECGLFAAQCGNGTLPATAVKHNRVDTAYSELRFMISMPSFSASALPGDKRRPAATYQMPTVPCDLPQLLSSQLREDGRGAGAGQASVHVLGSQVLDHEHKYRRYFAKGQHEVHELYFLKKFPKSRVCLSLFLFSLELPHPALVLLVSRIVQKSHEDLPSESL
ncbi:hypothetical protein mRhiFer1_009482 [Rhinolophus ferrumequinum]|uniref:Uncharacterized protein n=1 Tax=Rhinolophus ferrumequinum TaxID=59479 RepID=A0A7J7RF47_RHIFE|nr:hypothetical protein mRhiFer1_009482 [Rhinolophus ferrumequinum]